MKCDYNIKLKTECTLKPFMKIEMLWYARVSKTSTHSFFLFPSRVLCLIYICNVFLFCLNLQKIKFHVWVNASFLRNSFRAACAWLDILCECVCVCFYFENCATFCRWIKKLLNAIVMLERRFFCLIFFFLYGKHKFSLEITKAKLLKCI